MYAYHLVRTDAREQKLDAFVVPRSLQGEVSEGGGGDEEAGERGEKEAGREEEASEAVGEAMEVEVVRVEGGGQGKGKGTPGSSLKGKR